MLLIVMVVGPLTARAAEPPLTIENVRVGLEDTYQVGTWTAVRVELTGGPERFEGALEVVAPDADGTETVVRQPLVLTPRQPLTQFTAYTRPGSTDGESIVVRVRNARGRAVVPDARGRARNGQSPQPLDPNQALVAVLGNVQGVKEVAGLGGFRGNAQRGPLVVLQLDPRQLPARWIGLDAVSTLVIDTNDADVLEALRARRDVITTWARNGGHLVVTGAGHGQEVRELLGDVLPAVPNGTTRLNDLGEIESFAGSKNNPIPGKVMTVAMLEEAEERGGRVLSASTNTPLIVRGALGFGRVTLLGIDVDQKPFSDWKDRPLFWVRALDLKASTLEDEGGGGPGNPYRAGDLATLMHRALDRPPGVTPVPFGWVAFFVFLYILAIGPGDYLFLKHVVKRMEWTWLTFPLIVIATSLVAYGSAYALKGTDLKIMKVDSVDVDQASSRVRGSSWITLFSPLNSDYGVTIEPRSAAGTGTGPVAGVERLVSWFAPPEPQFGRGGGSRMGLGGARYDYVPEGQAEGLTGVRVPIWSTKSFLGRWSSPLGENLIESELAPAGYERLDGTITNRSAHTLRDVVLVYGRQVYDQLGTLAPNASKSIDLASRTRPLSGYLEERAQRLNAIGGVVTTSMGTTSTVDQPGELADLVRVMMFREDMSQKSNAPPSLAFKKLDLTGQLALDRPMLLATIDGPAAELRLDGAPSEPKIEQTTVLRVLLDLQRPAAP